MANIYNPTLGHRVVDYRNSPLAFKFLLLWIFVSIGRPQDIFPSIAILHLGDIAAAGILCTWFFLHPDQTNKKIFNYTEIMLVTLIFILMIALVPFATVRTQSFYFIKDTFLKTFIFFIISVKLIRTIKDIEYISWTLLFSMLSLSIAVFLIKGDTPSRISGRISIGTMYDPNDLALVLVTFLPIAMMFSFYSKGVQRIFGIIGSTLGVFGIILSQSRGGFLGLITIMILIFFNKSRFKIKYLTILLLLGIIFISFTPRSYWDRISTIKEGSKASERSLIWKRSLSMIYKNPLGYGAGNFPSAYGRYIANDPNAYWDDPDKWQVYAWRTAHNSFILIAVELGLLGLAMYIILYYKIYNNFQKIKKIFLSDTALYQYAEFFRISFVGYTVCAFFLSQSYSSIFFLIVAISSVMINVIANEIENNRKIVE